MQGIYKIINLVNDKIYIGSSKNLHKRELRHFNDLRKGRHHNIFLQRSFDKYGESSFKFVVLEETEDLFEKESLWISDLKPEYNIGGVCGGDNFTNHPEKELLRDKLSKILRNNPPPPRYGEDNPNWRGAKHTTCKCGSNKSHRSKTCEKCRDRTSKSNSFYGKKHSDESIEKMRKSQLGKKPSNSLKITIDGASYESCAEAARDLGVSGGTINYRLNNWENYKRVDDEML